jgi:hypothetical protein
MTRGKRTASSYRASVGELSKFVPSLEKYKSRKRKKGPRFTPSEKAAITRAEKKVQAAGLSSGILRPLTKRQAAALKDRSLLVGNGIRAVRLRGIDPTAKITVKNGKLIVTSGKRTWRFQRSAPFPKEVMRRAKQAFTRGAKAVDLWFVQGRLGFAAASLNLFAERVAEFFAQYAESDPDFDDWFQGIAYY